MRLWRYLFDFDRSPGGWPIPPRIGMGTLFHFLTLPIAFFFALVFNAPAILGLNVAIFLIGLVYGFFDREYYLRGMQAGRCEVIDEMIEAWLHHDIRPDEYLVREAAFGPPDEDAAKQVRETR